MSNDEQRAWLAEDQPTHDAGKPAPFQQVGVIDDDGQPAVEVRKVKAAGRRPRWLVPLTAAVVVVLAVTMVGAWALSTVLTGAPDAARTGYAYVPATATIVAEARLDLPAGQKEQLGTFLSRFPGFGDASTVESRLVDALDEAVMAATQGRSNYSDDVQPFFSGWVIGALSYRAAAPMAVSPLIVFGVSDRQAAEAKMLELREPALNWTAEVVDGVQVWSGGFVRDGDDLDFGFGGQAYAVTDDALLYGSTADDVKKALDTRAGKTDSLLDQARFADALKRIPAARLGLVWVDVAGTGSLAMMRPTMMMGGAACTTLTSDYPTDVIAGLYLRDGRATIDVSFTRPSGAPALPVRQSVLDTHVPADTFLYSETKVAALGMTSDTLECLRNMPGLDETIAELEQSIGSLDDLVGWIGDTAVAVRFDGSKVTGGVVVKVTDEIKASEALGQLRAALTALGNEYGSVTVNEETYRDARLVTFELAGAGVPSLPALVPSPSLAYAMKDGVLVIGIDASFARAVLDTEPSTSLASNAGYRRALEFAGATQNAGAMFVDVPAALRLYDAISASMPGATNDLAKVHEYLSAQRPLRGVHRPGGRPLTVRAVRACSA